jgi:HK97 gp10 family phage protein
VSGRIGASITFTTRSRLREVSTAIALRVEEGTAEIREKVAEKAEELAPKLTGELEESIGVDGDKVVATSPHALFDEYGTVYMEAQPFMRPAVKYGRDLMREMLRGIRGGL